MKASNRGGFGSLFFGAERKGISHIGYYKVLGPSKLKWKVRRTNSKIQVVYIEDNFPSNVADATDSMVRPGGGRFIGAETFNDAAHDTDITIAQVNHEKMGKLMLDELNKLISTGQYVKQKGEVVFPAHDIVLDEKGEPKLPEKKSNGDFVDPKDGWIMETDPNEVINKKNEIESRLKAARTTSEKSEIYEEFALWLQDRAADKMAELIDRGIIFMWISRGAYYKMSSYCTQMYIMAFLIANGFNPELVPDKGAPLTQKFNEIGKWSKKNMNKVPKFVQKFLKAFLNVGAVQNALLLNKLHRVFAPAGMFNQPYVDKNGIHKSKLVFSGLSNIMKTTTNEFFERVPKVRDALNQLLDPAKFQAVKSLDKYDIFGVMGHLEHIREIMNADNGIKNTHDTYKQIEERRKIIPKPKNPTSNSGTAPSCPAVFKTAG